MIRGYSPGMALALLCTAIVAIAVVAMGAHMYRMIQEYAWTCIHCGATSHNRYDVENHHCGNCHHYCEDVSDDDGAVWPPPPSSKPGSHVERSRGGPSYW